MNPDLIKVAYIPTKSQNHLKAVVSFPWREKFLRQCEDHIKISNSFWS